MASSEASVLRTKKGVFCPFCESLTTPLRDVREEAKIKGLGRFPIYKYVEITNRKCKFIPFSDEDTKQVERVAKDLKKLTSLEEWKQLVPTDRFSSSGSQVYGYGIDTFDKFYSPRQLLSIITLMKYVRLSVTEMEKENITEKRKKLIVLLLSFLVDKFARKNVLFTSWYSGSLEPSAQFSSPQYRMTWDYTEASPIRLRGRGSFGSTQKSLRKAIQNCMIPVFGEYKDDTTSVTNLKHQNESIDLIITDPPYYDYIEYGSLSDFFYVLLKRMVKDLFFDIFQTPLTPKHKELILKKGLSKEERGLEKKKLERDLERGWKEVARVLKKNGILVVMFTHRSTEAWEKMFLTLHKAGFYAVATWPVLSERVTKYMQKQANVNVTQLIICRKIDRASQAIGDYRDVQEELRITVYKKAKLFFRQGLSGADFFVVIQGPAMEIFAKYAQIEKSSGEKVELSHFIRLSQRYVSEFILEELFKIEASLDLDPVTRLYIMWRWSYGKNDISVDNYLLFCKVNSTREGYLEELGIVEKVGKRKILHLNQYNERNLPWENWKLNLKDQSIITRLHLSLLLLSKGMFSSFTEFLEMEGIKDTGHILVQVARVLEILFRPLVVDTGYSIPEHTMLQKFLDNLGVSFIAEDSIQLTLDEKYRD